MNRVLTICHQDFNKLIYSLLNENMNKRQYKMVQYVGIWAKQKEGNNHSYRYRNRIYCVVTEAKKVAGMKGKTEEWKTGCENRIKYISKIWHLLDLKEWIHENRLQSRSA